MFSFSLRTPPSPAPPLSFSGAIFGIAFLNQKKARCLSLSVLSPPRSPVHLPRSLATAPRKAAAYITPSIPHRVLRRSHFTFQGGKLEKQFGKGTICSDEERAFVSSPTDALETHPLLLPFHVQLMQLGAIAFFFFKCSFASFYSCALSSLIYRSKCSPCLVLGESGK